MDKEEGWHFWVDNGVCHTRMKGSSSVESSAYVLNFVQIRAKYERFFSSNTSEIRAKFVTFQKNTSAFIVSENWFLVVAGQLIALTGCHVLVS